MSAENVRSLIVEIASGELGVEESPPRSNMDVDGRIREYNNSVRDSRYTMKDGDSYCASFCSWVYEQAGVPLVTRYGTGLSYVPYLVDFAKETGRWNEKKFYPKAGDLVVSSENGERPDHVGIVTSSGPDGTIYSIEANYNNGVNERSSSVTSRILGFVSLP